MALVRRLTVIPLLVVTVACVSVQTRFSLGVEESSQVGNVGGSSVRIWLFDLKQPGDYGVRATGEAPCRKTVPPCETPTVRYQFNIRAR